MRKGRAPLYCPYCLMGGVDPNRIIAHKVVMRRTGKDILIPTPNSTRYRKFYIKEYRCPECGTLAHFDELHRILDRPASRLETKQSPGKFDLKTFYKNRELKKKKEQRKIYIRNSEKD